MRERPIIMSAESVRAILAGTKTQTRRAVRPQPGDVLPPIRVEEYEPVRVSRGGEEYAGDPIFGAYSADGEWGAGCPYGAPGDRLWVKETWGSSFVDIAQNRPYVEGGTWGSPSRPGRRPCVVFKADADAMPDDSPHETARWASPLFMPRWASRLTLEITEVRVQRVQEISEQDAEAEGIERPAPVWAALRTDGRMLNVYAEPVVGENDVHSFVAVKPDDLLLPRSQFRAAWDALNAKRGFPWASNPWVWAVTFKRVEGSRV